MSMQSAPSATPQAALESATAQFNAGCVAEGIAVLEHALARHPYHPDLLGYLAWAKFGRDDLDGALALYDRLIETNGPTAEALFRRAQVVAKSKGKDGRVGELLPQFFELLEKMPRAGRLKLSVALVDDLRNALVDENDPRLLKRLARLIPGNHPAAGRIKEAQRHLRRKGWKDLGRGLIGRLPIRRTFQFLLRYRIFREALAQASPDSESFRKSRIEKFYQEGSVGITFPQAPPKMAPSVFAEYMATEKCAWFEWMKANSPQAITDGHRLLDVGAGPGFVGHHFKWLGYRITAVTGSEAERAECEQRGMETLICDMHEMPLPSASFDAALASHVLEHSVAPMFLLWEIWRVLKPGGLLYVNLPLPIDAEPRRDHPQIWDETTDTYSFQSDALGQAVIPEATYYSYGFPPHVFVLSPYQWKWIFRQAGFRTLAACIETPQGEHWELEEGLERLGRRPHHCNQLFVLTKE